MTGVVHIARCPVHGLHGARETCFAYEHEGRRDCDGTVEQVPMVPVRDITDERRLLDTLAEAAGLLRECDAADEAEAVDEIAAWIFTYGPLEEWAKGAQQAHARAERLHTTLDQIKAVCDQHVAEDGLRAGDYIAISNTASSALRAGPRT